MGGGAALWCPHENEFWNQLRRVDISRSKATWNADWNEFKVECQGATIEAYLNDKLLLSGNDDHWKAGRIAFYAMGGLTRIKDIKIEGSSATLEKPWHIVEPPKVVGAGDDLFARVTDPSGKLEISVGEPFTMSSPLLHPEVKADFHHLPMLFKLPNGDILLAFMKTPDSLDFKGLGAHMRSRDMGRTWTLEPPYTTYITMAGALRDGTVLCYDYICYLKEPGIFCAEMSRSTDGGQTFEGPLVATIISKETRLPRWLPNATTHMYRKETSARWSDRPGIWFWRRVVELDDGALLASCNTCLQVDNAWRDVCYKSTDKGMSWHYLSTVDPGSRSEPVMSKCSDGSILCVMRRNGYIPLMQARSRDGGVTWEPARETGACGVDPDLCLMSNGVLACSYGRPGNRIMFSIDGTGEKWTDKTKVYEYGNGLFGGGASFGYTGIVEAEPGKLLFAYDQFDTLPESAGRKVWAVRGVFVTVTKK